MSSGQERIYIRSARYALLVIILRRLSRTATVSALGVTDVLRVHMPCHYPSIAFLYSISCQSRPQSGAMARGPAAAAAAAAGRQGEKYEKRGRLWFCINSATVRWLCGLTAATWHLGCVCVCVCVRISTFIISYSNAQHKLVDFPVGLDIWLWNMHATIAPSSVHQDNGIILTSHIIPHPLIIR